MKTVQNIFKSHRLSLQTKIRVFEAYVSSVFLFNSELWVLTKTLNQRIDSFQRRLLRRVLNIKWPKVTKNDIIYERTKTKRWSQIIKKGGCHG